MTLSIASLERRLAALPAQERALRRGLLERIAEVVVTTPLDDVVALVERLEDAAPAVDASDESWSLAEARARNLLRVLADQARIARSGIPARELRTGMNVSRQRLHQLVSEDRLLAIQLQAGAPSIFPVWQFAPEAPVRPIAGLERLIRAAREAGMDPLTLHFFMTEPAERLGGQTPQALLDRGQTDQVIDLMRASGLGPF